MPAKSIKDNILNGGLSLFGISKALGDKDNLAVRALLNTLIVDLVGFYNLGKTMNTIQVTQTVDLIVKRYHYFKPADFKLCFERAKFGDYGQMFDRIDGQLILLWLMKYDSERDLEIEQIRVNEKKAITESLKEDEKSEFVNPVHEAIKSYFAAKKEKPPEPKESGPIIQNETQIMHNRWMKQFSILRKRQEFNDKKINRGFVFKYGRYLDINDYLIYKQNQYINFNKP